MTASDRHNGDLSEIQRRGMAAAGEVFDRLIAELDGLDGRRPIADAGLGDGDRSDPADVPQLRAAFARTVDLYADLFRRTLELYADIVESVLRSDGAAGPEASSAGAEVVLAGAPGGEAVAAVWIHNPAARPIDAVVLRMTDLTADDGAQIDGAAATFAPPRLGIGPGASRSTSLSVRVPAAAAHGTYVGHVLARGLPGARLSVCLVVAP